MSIDVSHAMDIWRNEILLLISFLLNALLWFSKFPFISSHSYFFLFFRTWPRCWQANPIFHFVIDANTNLLTFLSGWTRRVRITRFNVLSARRSNPDLQFICRALFTFNPPMINIKRSFISNFINDARPNGAAGIPRFFNFLRCAPLPIGNNRK